MGLGVGVGLGLRLRAGVTCDGWLASSRSRSRSRAAARSRICWAVCMTLSSRAASSVGPNLASSRSMRIDSVRKTSLYLWGRARAERRYEHMHASTRCGRHLCTGGQGHQGSSEVITGHQRSSVRLYRRSRFLRHSAMLTRCSKKRLPCTKRSRAISTQSGRNQDAIKAYLQLHLDHGALLLLGELLEIHLRSRGQLGRPSEGGH